MDIETGSVLANRGLNYGYGFNQGNFAGDGSAIKEAVLGNRAIDVVDSINNASQAASHSTQVSDGFSAIRTDMNTNNQFLTDRINAQAIDAKFANVTAQLASAERLAFANAANAQREANANQIATINQLHAMEVKQTECCCELKAGQAAILAKLDADRAAAAEREGDNLRLQLQIINSNGNGRGNSGN